MVCVSRCSSPLGEITLAAEEGRLTGLWLAGQKHFMAGVPADAREDASAAPFPQARQWLRAYFAGRRPDPRALPLAPEGTPFQRRVWQALGRVPYGQTVSYGELARRTGSSPRAVGGAVGRNPISIVIPCHRVLGGDGSLTGYAGGVESKRRLLALEKAQHFPLRDRPICAMIQAPNNIGRNNTMKDTLRFSCENKPLMIAHRGMSGLELENTASAFVAAGQRTYFGIETDVHRTADGEFIIIHDDSTKRVGGDEMIVEETCYETLRAIRLVDKDGKKGRRDLIMPSLREYIQICKKYEKTAVLELKNHFKPADLYRIIDIIAEEDYLESTIFISFDLPNMICIRERLPQQQAQFLISDYTDWLLDTLKKERLDLDIKYTALTKERVDALHEAGIKVNVWTVDTLEDAQRMADYGVDFITSNIVE